MYKLQCLLLGLLLHLSINAQDGDPPTVQICGETQFVCIDNSLYDLCVSINNNNFSQPIDYFEIDWGDDEEPTILDSDASEANHLFDLSDFYLSSNYEVEYLVRLNTYVVGEDDPVNSIFVLTFRNPPTAQFSIRPPIICVGGEACFNSTSFPTRNLEIVEWDYGDNTTGMEECHTYNQAGTYNVKLKVMNPCGMDEVVQQLRVIEAPIARAEVVSGVSNDTQPYTICLGDGLVELNGINSTNQTFYEWDVSGSNSNHNWIVDPADNSPNVANPTIQFLRAGEYEVYLEVNNECDKPDVDTLQFIVLATDGGFPNEVEDACESLEFTPEPLDNDVTYSLNGNVVNNFPITLSPDTYILEASNPDNPCFALPYRDTFIVSEPQQAMITTTAIDHCSQSGDLILTAEPADGNWTINGEPFNGVINSAVAQNGINIITYGRAPCVTEDRLEINFLNVEIELPNASDLCLDATPIQLETGLDFVTWTGNGITNPNGTFSPSEAGEGEHLLTATAIHPTDSTCNNQQEITIGVAELAVDFRIDTCSGNTLFFDTLNTGTFNRITWNFGDGGTSNNVAPSHDYATAGTYTVTVEVSNPTCTATESREIIVEPAPAADFTTAYEPLNCSVLEVNITDNSAGSNLRYEWEAMGQTSDSPTPPPFLLEAIEQDTLIELRLTLSNDCAADVHTEMIPVRPRALARFGTQFDSYCSGDTILLSNNARGNPSTYEWTQNGVVIATDSVPPIISYRTETVDSIEICLTVSNDCGTDNICRNILVRPTDVEAFFNTAPDPICVGDTVRLTNFATNGVPVSYDFGDNTESGLSNPTHVYATAGVYQIEQKAFGCGFASFSSTVEVLAIPEVAISAPLTNCPKTDIMLSTTSEAADEFLWELANGETFNSSNITTRFDSAGIYNNCVTVTGKNGCKNQICQSLEIVEPPTLAFTVTDSVCADTPIQFTNQTNAAGDCQWLFGDGNFSSECNTEHLYENADLYSVGLAFTTDLGCKDTLFQPLFVREVPQPIFAAEITEDCAPNARVSFINETPNADSYEWDFGDNNNSLATNPNHNYAAGGNYEISLTATKDGVCSATTTQTIMLAERPTALIEVSEMEGCSPFTIDFIANVNTTDSIKSYNWDFGDNQFNFNQNTNHTYTTADSFKVQLIVTTEKCADTTTLSPIIIHPELRAEWTTENPICQGDATGIITLNPLGGTPNFAYTWSDGITTANRSELSAADYQLTVTDAADCQFTTEISIFEPAALSVATTEAIPVSCFGGNDGSITVAADGGVADYNYQWETGTTLPQLTNLSAADYNLTITDANGCELLTSVAIPTNAAIAPNDELQHISCFGAKDGHIILDQEITGGIAPYLAELFGENDYFAEGLRFENLPPGNYELTVEDALGCTQTFSRRIADKDSLFVNIRQEGGRIQLGDSLSLPTQTNAAVPVYEWFPNQYLNCDDCSAPLMTPFQDMAYTVQVTDMDGCQTQDTISFALAVERGIYVPNAFTPNGDGNNDIFRIRSDNPAVQRIRTFKVYDRWGELVYARDDFLPSELDAGWDGRYRNLPVAAGVFTWFAEVEYIDRTERFAVFQGNVSLLR